MDAKRIIINRNLAVIFLLGIFAGLFSGQATAKTIIVTQTDDVTKEEPALFGTLRDAIRNRADPGDTIIFHVKGPVTLLDVIRIPPRLAGLTIQGPVTLKPARGFRGLLIVEADDVTIRGRVTFMDTSLIVQKLLDGIPFRVETSRVLDNRFRGDSEIFMSEVNNCTIKGNKLNVSPSGATGNSAIITNRTRDCLVTENTIISRSDFAIHDTSSHDVRYIGNKKIKGDVLASPVSGEISDNKINGVLTIHPPDFYDTNGLLTVARNTAMRMSIRRTFIDVLNNTLSGAATGGGTSSALFFENSDPRGPQGPVLIEDNTLTGGSNGIDFLDTPTSAKAVIFDNHISDCDNAGISVRRSRDVLVSENDITACGVGTAGKGIVVNFSSTGGAIVEKNVITNIVGAGILVTPQGDGIEVVLRNNEITGSETAGIILLRNPNQTTGRVLMEGNTIIGSNLSGIIGESFSNGTVRGGEIRDNLGDGISVLAGSNIEISQVSMANNTGPGIDISPSGVTQNNTTKTGNNDLD